MLFPARRKRHSGSWNYRLRLQVFSFERAPSYVIRVALISEQRRRGLSSSESRYHNHDVYFVTVMIRVISITAASGARGRHESHSVTPMAVTDRGTGNDPAVKLHCKILRLPGWVNDTCQPEKSLTVSGRRRRRAAAAGGRPATECYGT